MHFPCNAQIILLVFSDEPGESESVGDSITGSRTERFATAE